ncbi:MAG: alpha/beta hydrolase, partial [Coxiellaceae bacterium]|nr:alpha/beta hydrolase [Coxiellaceae bacterium]
MKTKISLDDGFNINMHVFGPEDGKPMLGLHGLMDNAASFDLLAPYLEGIRLYAIDLPGHGFSDFLPPYCEYTFDNLIPFIFKIADALGLKTFSIIGHSFGAIIGELCAAAIPDRIEKLVLLDIMGIRTASDEKIINAILDHIKRYQSPLPAHTLYQS